MGMKTLKELLFSACICSIHQHLTHYALYFDSSCQLTGPIPSSIGNLHLLIELNLGDNLLTGTLPESVGNFENLQQFSLSNNRLGGSLPSTIASWSNLESFLINVSEFLTPHLSLVLNRIMIMFHSLTLWHVPWHHYGLLWQDNEFVGTLPPVSWPNLLLFRANDNALSGTLSESIGSFSRLSLFQINRNKFTGTLPYSIGLWTDLKLFYTSGNAAAGNAIDFEVLYISGFA